MTDPEMRKRVWARFLKALEVFNHLAVICGIIFVALEYSNREDERREQAALQYLQNFQRADITDARLRLQAYWFDKPLAQISGMPGSEGVVASFADDQIFPAQKPPDADDLLRVIEQLDVLGACAASSVCDREMLVSQIGETTHSYLCLYASPLERLRKDHSYKTLGLKARTLQPEGAKC